MFGTLWGGGGGGMKENQQSCRAKMAKHSEAVH